MADNERPIEPAEKPSHQLRQAGLDLAAVIDSSPIAIIGLDADANVIVWNNAAQRIFGFTAAEALGRPHPVVPATEREHFMVHFQRAMQGEALHAVAGTRQRKDGRQIDVAFSSGPIRDAQGRQNGVLYFVEDVSDQRAMQNQLQHAQKMEAIGQLTGGMAHDFNNLLGTIIGSLEMLQNMVPQQAQEFVDMALQASLRGAELNRSLLAFARRQPLRPRKLDPTAQIRETMRLCQRMLGESITIDVLAAESLWQVNIDPAQFETALLNICLNARDAMAGGGRLTIESRNISLRDEAQAEAAGVLPGDFIAVSVTDTGSGMPPEVLSRAFEPFFTTKAVGAGSGLGLSMVYGFAKQSGGYSKIYSEIGRGTTVRLYLPRAEPGEAEASSVPETKPRGGSETILVVEDNEALRLLAIRQLTALGYRTLEAGSGPEALAVLESSQPVDLLFTDIVMPGGLDGPKLAERALRLRPSLKVLFTSGFTEASMANSTVPGQAIQLISKPYRSSDLATRVRRILDSGR